MLVVRLTRARDKMSILQDKSPYCMRHLRLISSPSEHCFAIRLSEELTEINVVRPRLLCGPTGWLQMTPMLTCASRPPASAADDEASVLVIAQEAADAARDADTN